MVLQDIIRGATSQCLDDNFFTQQTRHEQERDVRAGFLGDGQGAEAIKLVQAVIGKNHVRRFFCQGAHEIVARFHATRAKLYSTATQLTRDQLRIVRIVFNEQNPNVGAGRVSFLIHVSSFHREASYDGAKGLPPSKRERPVRAPGLLHESAPFSARRRQPVTICSWPAIRGRRDWLSILRIGRRHRETLRYLAPWNWFSAALRSC